MPAVRWGACVVDCCLALNARLPRVTAADIVGGVAPCVVKGEPSC
jgi:hypothetical protein